MPIIHYLDNVWHGFLNGRDRWCILSLDIELLLCCPKINIHCESIPRTRHDFKSVAASMTPEKGSSSGVLMILSITSSAVPTHDAEGGAFLKLSESSMRETEKRTGNESHEPFNLLFHSLEPRIIK